MNSVLEAFRRSSPSGRMSTRSFQRSFWQNGLSAGRQATGRPTGLIAIDE